MNTKFYTIIEKLSNSFEMVKRILKDYEDVYMRVKSSSGSPIKKKKNIKLRKFRRMNKKNKLIGVSNFFMPF